MTSDTSSSATSQYHAQLYSGQKQLQKRHQQQQQQVPQVSQQIQLPISERKNRPTSINYKPLSFEAPNLYHTSLKLTTETEIHAWWTSLVKILSGNSFHATRIALSIPQDPNDPFTGPWGLKAVYNKTGSISQESDATSVNSSQDISGTDDYREDDETRFDYFLHSHTVHETCPRHVPWCFDRLQPFESEPEPLINNPSVGRILRRNSPVVLSREYRRKSSSSHKRPSEELGLEMFKRALLDQTSEKKNWSLPIITTPCFSKDESTEILVDSGSNDESSNNTNHVGDEAASAAATFLQDYDEYEQQQPSPWSQSPAPSPAIMDPEINPFFQSPPDIDDEAFNPVSPESYDNTSVPFPPPISNVHSIVHVPLFHPSDVVDKPNQHQQYYRSMNQNPTPIAILSFLAPIVPYPPVLLSSINSLSPFIAASFTNAIKNSKYGKKQSLHNNTTKTDTKRKSPNNNNNNNNASITPTTNDISSLNDNSDDNNDDSTTTSITSRDDENIDESNYDSEEEEEELYHHNIGSTNTTPTTIRPSHLDQMSAFTRSSLETVTDSYEIQQQLQQEESSDDLSTTQDSSFSSIKRGDASSQPPPHRKRSSQTSISSSATKERKPSRSYTSLSPSSVAVMEGWGAVSPTTGLPISSSIPPHNMCGDKKCLHDHHPTGHYSEDESDDTDTFAKTTETEENLFEGSYDDNLGDAGQSFNSAFVPTESISPISSTVCMGSLNDPKKDTSNRKRHSRWNKPLKRKSRYYHKRPNSSLNSKKRYYDDDGFHYHGLRNHGLVDKFLVAPKSSLLRLIIDGIPIHVFTCSTSTGQVTWINNRTLQYTGRSLKDHLGPKWLSHMHPDDQPECKKAWEFAYQQGNGLAGEYRLRRFDGVYRCFLWRIVPLRDTKGRIIHWFGTCTDVHDQHVAKESNLRQVEIESNERKYRLLAEAIPQIVFTFSPSVGLTYTNGKWIQYSGKTFDQTMGLGFMSCVHPEDRSKLQLPDLPPLVNKAGISWQSEIRLLSANDEYRWFLVKCVSVDELDNGDVRWFGTCTDINDHKLLEKKLKEAHDAAQKSTESKTRFLSNMSHEIRTPLIGITGMLNFLLDTELTAEQMDYVHTIQQSAESLLVVINDILDLSKVEAGMMKLEWEPFSLVTMIEDANELLSTLAIQKDLELSFWVEDDVPDVLVGDRVRLRQVMLNLIGNAIKFTSEGEVFTRCTVQRNDKVESELTLLFEVIDTGAGFDAMEESVMFKPFSQVDSSSTRKHGGSGLGLVISRQLIELHGGQMKCKSEKGKGSIFYFTVKFFIPASQTKPQPHTPNNDSHNDPFFRSNGYGNNNTAQAIVERREESEDSPVTFVNINRLIPSSSTSLSFPMSGKGNSDHSSAEILQDVLMNKAASMQLKPPPIRNPTTTTVGVDQFLSPPLKAEGQISLPANPRLSTSELRIPTIGTGPGLPNSPSSVVILPPRTPTSISPLRALVVSQWTHSRESMVKHVQSILGGLSEHFQVDAISNQIEAQELLMDPHTLVYDYIMINLSSEQQILSLTRAICGSMQQQKSNVLVVTTPMQRSLITESAKGREDQVIPATCGFVFKPLKRTKLRWYFGVRQKTILQDCNDNGESMVTTPDTPYKRAATQKEIFRRMKADVGGQGFHVLLVEDNLVNQKVLTKYLTRVGLGVDVAVHGGECIDMFFKHPIDYYCLILCDLFMPVKDGYETTREIRKWEKENLLPDQEPKPIVALSANVMSDVANKCLECGFSTYISKPVNFAILSDVIRGYLLRK